MKACLGLAEVRHRKTTGCSVIEIEVMPAPGQETALHKALVQFLHGERVMVSIAPEELSLEKPGILEA